MTTAAAAKITSWITAALASWIWSSPAGQADAQGREALAAQQIEAVAFDPAEEPLYRGPNGRARTAALLASIAANETRLDAKVLAGNCRPGTCDGGEAYGAFQIHPGKNGIALLPRGYVHCGAREPADRKCYTGAEIVADGALGARVALHMLRHTGLGSYTGEGSEGPLAQKRKGDAQDWAAAHPPPASDADVLASDPAATASE